MKLHLKGLANLFERLAEPVIVVDERQLILLLNRAAEETLGYRAEETLGQPLAMLMPNDSFDPISLFAGAGSRRADIAARASIVRTQRKDGAMVDSPVQVFPIARDDKELYAIVMENHMGNPAPAESSDKIKRLHALIEHGADGITLLDAQGSILYRSPANQRISGYTDDELMGHNGFEVIHPEDRSNLQVLIKTIREKPRAIATTEYRQKHREGHWVWIEATATNLLADPTVNAYVINYRDITARKQAEVALRASEERFAKAFHSNSVAMSIADTTGRFIDVNESFLQLSGYTRVELIGNTSLDLNLWHDPYQRMALAQVIHEKRSVRDVQTRLRTKSGEIRDVLAFGELIDIGRQSCVLVSLHDTTAQTRADQETRRRAQLFAALYETAQELATECDLPALWQKIVDRAARLLDASGATMYLYDELRGDLILTTSTGPAVLIGTRLGLGEGLAGRVAQTRQPLVVEDYRTWEGRSAKFQDTPFGAIIQVPMLNGGQLLGVLSVRELAVANRKFTEEDVRLLSLFASQAASAAHNARLLEETRQRLTEVQAVNRISAALRGAQSLDELLPLFMDETLAAIGADTGAIWLDGTGRDELRVAVARGWFEKIAQPTRCGEGLVSQVFATGQARVLRDFADSAVPCEGDAFLLLPGWGGACVPIRVAKDIIGVLLIAMPLPRELSASETRLLSTLAEIAGTALHRTRLHESLTDSYNTTLEGWSRALDMRDSETEGHTRRVTEMTLRLARAMGIPEEELAHWRRGALLHDIGKMGIPDGILLKAGPLTDKEWAIMREHPNYAYELLLPVEHLRPALDIPYCHHEKWDGTGYPRGLKGEEIPLAARVFAVADVWDALSSERRYRPAWNPAQVRDYIRAQAGAHFDPQVVEEFLKMDFCNPLDLIG